MSDNYTFIPLREHSNRVSKFIKVIYVDIFFLLNVALVG